MNGEELKTLTLEELQKKQKIFAILAYTLGGITLILLLSFLYSLFMKEKHSSNLSLGALPLPLILIANYLNKIEEEIKSRNSQL
jgi:chromate transport protein ChrA